MAKQEIEVKWVNNMSFETEVNGHKVVLDADSSVGGENLGPRPKPFMMVSLAGCTGMDVVSILKKMRVEVDEFSVKIVGDLTEEHPKHFYRMHVIYQFKGKNLPMDKLQKAVKLSEDQYCGVSAVYKKAMELTSEIQVIE